jgi:toxin-antitoxin system PIN domain toxin
VSVTVDAGILLHASDSSSRLHEPAVSLVRELASGPEIFYLFWPVALAYMRVATDLGVFREPMTHEQAKANIDGLLARPNVRAVGEEDAFWEAYGKAAPGVFLRGDFVAHGYLVSLIRQYRVWTLWSHDPEFKQFPGITVRDPFIPQSAARAPGR